MGWRWPSCACARWPAAAKLDTDLTLSPDSRFRPALYGVIHALVDAACVVAVVRASHQESAGTLGAFWTVLSYDLLAFALQFPLGLLADRLRLARASMILGVFLSALVVAPVSMAAWPTMLMAGVGNALFHLGAGGLVLSSSAKAGPAGVFVGPGALGLGLGLWMGRTGWGSTFPIHVALVFALAVLLVLDRPAKRESAMQDSRGKHPPLMAAVILSLLLVSVLVRAFVGFGACFQCPSGWVVALGIPLAACTGKVLGGMVADRLGWLAASLGGLVLSLPLIALSGGSLWLALPGVLLFQSTMAVTLMAVARLMPAWPCTAFGLPSLFLVLGSLPTFYPLGQRLYGGATFALLLALSAAALGLALLYLNRIRMNHRGHRGHRDGGETGGELGGAEPVA
jgi:MFS transporter, FSR family, fosmidomycin resistance protein